MPYLGNEPATAFTSTTKDTFSGDASTTDFTMSKAANVNAVRVVVENVVQNPTVAYTCSGTTLSFTSAPPTGTNNIYVVHLGPPAATIAPPTTINNNTTFTGGVSLKNETPEDTDGGRESKVTFKGLQSGEEESTLAEIQASHDGTSDDQKGDLIFKTNDGSDNAAPTEALKIDSNQRLSMTRGDTLTELSMDANRSGAGASIGRFNYFWNGTHVAKIEGLTGSDTTNKDDGELRFQTRESGGALADRWKITSEGHFKAMSNGLGIDFSASETSGQTITSSVLDDYEEGVCTLSPTYSNVTLNTAYVKRPYIKIGRFVTISVYLQIASESGSDVFYVDLPFTAATSPSNGTNTSSQGVMHEYLEAGNAGLCYYINSGSNQLRFYRLDSSGSNTWDVLRNSDLSATGGSASALYCTVTYQTA